MPHLELDATALGQAPPAEHALAAILARRAELGFLELPDDRATARACMDFARALDRDIDTVVVLGIGGSSLPARALHAALVPALDALAPRSPGMPRRILFADNIDPASFGALLERVDPRRTLWNVISKSGGTAETCAQLCIVADRLGELAATRIVATTDPTTGALGEVARARGWPCFAIPAAVSGRLSTLTPVGLLPAALAGLDVAGLLDGARRMRDRVLVPADNPALRLASALHHHHVAHGRAMVVTIAYADGLYAMLEWLGQLWCESLGKQGRGSTPIAARGAPDQHAQLQLWADGPDDKVYVFVTVGARGPDVAIPAAVPHADWQYLAGRGLGELLDIELAATIDSLIARGRPVARIVLPRASAEAVGELALLLEMTSLVAAPLYGVDPAGEPGVEDGKRRAFAALGRPGYAHA